MSKKLVCTQCGYIGKAEGAIKGSALVEIFLWFLLIIPGLIYSVWRSSSRYKVCPKCKSPSLIPVDSPRAKKIMLDNGVTNEEILTIQQETDIGTGSKYLDWCKAHPIYTTLILLIGVPMIFGMISAVFGW
jgi:hypothetical protein